MYLYFRSFIRSILGFWEVIMFWEFGLLFFFLYWYFLGKDVLNVDDILFLFG